MDLILPESDRCQICPNINIDGSPNLEYFFFIFAYSRETIYLMKLLK